MTDQSYLEHSFEMWLQAEAPELPQPEREHQFSPPRRWRFDFAWPEQKVAVEIEGLRHGNGGRHQRVDGFVRDAEKYEAALLEGWTVYRIPGPWIATSQGHVWREKCLETLRTLMCEELETA